MKKIGNKVLSIVLTFLMVISAIGYIPLQADAAGEGIDITNANSSVLEGNVTVRADGKYELHFTLPVEYNDFTKLKNAGASSIEVAISVSEYTGGDSTPGAMLFMYTSGPEHWENTWMNLSDVNNNSKTFSFDFSPYYDAVLKSLGIQFTNLAPGSTLKYSISSIKLITDGKSDAISGGESGQEYVVQTGDATSNYAKLLQESLYFYDSNMCGEGVSKHSAFSWRGDCHLQDKNAVVIIGDRNGADSGERIDISGGYHDAGDHIKFSLTNGYAATVLGIAYLEFEEAFKETNSASHFKVISDYFASYLKKCTVLDGDSVKYFIFQVGNGDDHNFWGAPEKQTAARYAYATSANCPATDQVSLSAAALALNYLNFKDAESLSYAKKLFAYAKANMKKVCDSSALIDNNGSWMYKSTSWADDYALAAALLYKATGENGYLSDFSFAKNANGGYNIYSWFSWDNVSALADYYGTGDASALLTCANNMKASDNGYSCLSEWGSARYNCNMQLLGLLYDKASSKNIYSAWATKQMNYILGNGTGQCFVVGYNSLSSKYPHHRAASNSSDASQISANHHILLGALVGGPSDSNGTYSDLQSDYRANEVALDYNAGLVGAAAGLYMLHKNNENVPKSLMSADDIKNVELRFNYGLVENKKEDESSTSQDEQSQGGTKQDDGTAGEDNNMSNTPENNPTGNSDIKDNNDNNASNDNNTTNDSKDKTANNGDNANNAEAGVGKISADGKVLTDTSGKKYYVSTKLTNSDLKKNLPVADKKSDGKYKITKITRKKGKVVSGTVTYMAPYNKKCTKMAAPKTVKIGGVKFKVTAIEKNAFKNCKKLKTATFEANIAKIGANAFSGCSNLKTVNIRTTKLTGIGSNAFKGINKKVKFSITKKVTGKKLKKYIKMLKKSKAPGKWK